MFGLKPPLYYLPGKVALGVFSFLPFFPSFLPIFSVGVLQQLGPLQAQGVTPKKLLECAVLMLSTLLLGGATRF